MTSPSLFVPDRDTSRRLYCGPTALCAVTGLPASKILATIEGTRGERAYTSRGTPKGVRGMRIKELRSVLNELGYPAYVIPQTIEPTFARWLEMRKNFPIAGPAIVRIRGHFLAVSGDGKWVCDTKTKVPVLAYRAPNRRARVTHVLYVKGRSK